MNWLFSVFFGAGLAAWAYSRMNRRIGYGNTQSNVVLVLAVFIIASLAFYITLTTILSI